MSTAATNKKVIAITGASSGIGKETAKQLVNNGFNVALLARSEDKLRALVEEFGNDVALNLVAPTGDCDARIITLSVMEPTIGWSFLRLRSK